MHRVHGQCRKLAEAVELSLQVPVFNESMTFVSYLFNIITAQKGGCYASYAIRSVCVRVCVCEQDSSNSCERISSLILQQLG